MRRFEASPCKAAPKGQTFIFHAAPLQIGLLHQPLLRVQDTTQVLTIALTGRWGAAPDLAIHGVRIPAVRAPGCPGRRALRHRAATRRLNRGTSGPALQREPQTDPCRAARHRATWSQLSWRPTSPSRATE